MKRYSYNSSLYLYNDVLSKHNHKFTIFSNHFSSIPENSINHTASRLKRIKRNPQPSSPHQFSFLLNARSSRPSLTTKTFIKYIDKGRANSTIQDERLNGLNHDDLDLGVDQTGKEEEKEGDAEEEELQGRL